VRESDLSEVYDIETDCFVTSWPMKAFEDALSSLESFVLYLLGDNRLVGFFIGGGVEDEYNIYNFAIKPSQQRRGFGWYLLNTVIDNHFKRYENYFLEVRKSNNSAIAMYYKFGFRYVYERRNYYSNPVEDALIMKYSLSEG
jgi:ribosomal-protein-alanine N-acetyltransferase